MCILKKLAFLSTEAEVIVQPKLYIIHEKINVDSMSYRFDCCTILLKYST